MNSSLPLCIRGVDTGKLFLCRCHQPAYLRVISLTYLNDSFASRGLPAFKTKFQCALLVGVFGRYIRILPGQALPQLPLPFKFCLESLFLPVLLYNTADIQGIVPLPEPRNLLQRILHNAQFLVQAGELLAVFIRQFSQFLLMLIDLDFKRLRFFLRKRDPFLGSASGKAKRQQGLLQFVVQIQKAAILLYQAVRQRTNLNLSFILVKPLEDVPVLPFKLGKLPPEINQVNPRFLVPQGPYDDVLDEIGIHLGAQEHVLKAPWNILILSRFHNTVRMEGLFR